jgi:hypothetical protein
MVSPSALPTTALDVIIEQDNPAPGRRKISMGLELASTRPLTEAELSLLNQLSTLSEDRLRRREFLRLMRISAVLMCPLLPTRRAQAANIFAIVNQVKVWGPVGMGLGIPAAITMLNSNSSQLTGEILLEHIDPTGRIRNRATYPVVLPLGASTWNHERFLAETVGRNEYFAISEINRASDIFDVFRR